VGPWRASSRPAAGFGLALTGWMLVMTVLLVFIGLPRVFFGLAVMQPQER
jgi:K+ transporter